MNGPKHIDKWVRKEILAADAYHAPAAAGMVKLDAMENPHSLPEKLREAWSARLKKVPLNRYPDPRCAELKKTIRATFGVGDEHGLVLGNGSDELIQMLALLVGGGGRTFVAPTPTFSMYQLIAAATATGFAGVPLTADYNLDGDALVNAINRHQPACVFLSHPNNPTGNRFDEAVVNEVLVRAPGVVAVDEAYFAFCRRSYLKILPQHPDMMILRTLSKSGMAGLRLGMLIAHPKWTAQLEKIRLPYNINALTQVSVQFCLEHHAVIEQQADDIVRRREVVYKKLSGMPGVQAYPSDANFILFRVENDADDVQQKLKARGVLIKNLNGADPLLKNCLRVTVGADTETKKFLEALADGID